MTPPSPGSAGGAGPAPSAGLLGWVATFGELAYDERGRLFLLDGVPCPLDRVRALDRGGLVRWRFLEQRDWMRRLPAAPFEEAYQQALERRLAGLPVAERLDEELRAHARKDASYLHGRIVEDGVRAQEGPQDTEGFSAGDRDLASKKE